MRVTLRCYGNVGEAVGSRSVELSLPTEATAEDALETLGEEYPSVDRLRAGTNGDLVMMRDRRHLDRDTPLADGDVVSVSTSPMPE